MTNTSEQKHASVEEEMRRSEFDLLFFTLAVKDCTPEEKLKLISEAIIIGCNNFDQASIGLLPIIKGNFKNHPSFYRSYLRELYLKLPGKQKVGSAEIEIAPRLKLAILKEILKGWYWWYDDPTTGKEPMRFNKDSKECLRFTCEAFISALIDGKFPSTLSGEILNLVRDYFHNQPLSADAFTPWITPDFMPPQIAAILLKTRVSRDPAKALQELRFIEAFDLHNRSENVVQLGKNFLADLKRIEDITVALANRIQSMEKTFVFPGHKIDGQPLFEVKCFIDNAGLGVIEVHFKYKPTAGYGIVAQHFEIEKESLLKEVVLLPANAIKIYLMSPDGTIKSPR